MEKEEIQIFTKTSKTKIINIIEKENYKDLEENVLLTIALEKLPKNYNFEIYKSIKKIREISKKNKKKKSFNSITISRRFINFFIINFRYFINFCRM